MGGFQRDHVYDAPLEAATLLRRYKRFLADVERADGTSLTVHCPNPGSMAGVSAAGSAVRIRDSHNPARKLRFTLEQVRAGRSWVGVNTQVPNGAVRRAIERGGVPALRGYASLRSEVPDGLDSRLDLRLDGPAGACWVEIKNTTWRVGHEGRFPDAVTTRGRKHVDALRTLRARGARAVAFFLVSRRDVRAFRPAWDVDPAYAAALRDAAHAGVEVVAHRVRLDADGVAVAEPLPVSLDPA